MDYNIFEGSLEVKLPIIWTDEKQRWKESEKRKERRSKKRKSQKQVREKVGKSPNTVFFPMICGSGGSKSRLAKAAGAEQSGQMRDEQLHAVVARSTFPSQNVQNTPTSDDFWGLRCRKSARRCGAKLTSKSKVLKTDGLGALLEVDMSKTHAVVAHNTFLSQKCKKLRGTEHFWTFGCCFAWQRHKGFCTLSKMSNT